LQLFKEYLDTNPKGITVWGGPNFPQRVDEQMEFLSARTQVDIYVKYEGEIGFSELVAKLLKIDSSPIDKLTLFAEPIDGCVIQKGDSEFNVGKNAARFKMLDDIPSPYLTGWLDKFFDKQLKPEIQTNRGCPFTCTFCVDGSDHVSKVNKFSLARVEAEIEYISSRVNENIGTLGISDLNFGMYSRDLDICKLITKYQKRHGFPTNIVTTTGKNKKERIISAVKTLKDSLRLSLSMQSMDQQVLENIRRENISASTMFDIMIDAKSVGLRTVSEVIIGLPGDTFESVTNTIRTIFNIGVDNIQMYTLMLLEGSELNQGEQREKWRFTTRWRLLARDFAELRSGARVLEVEEVVVSSSTLEYQEYLDLRDIALIVWIVSHGILFDPLLKLFSSRGIDRFELVLSMYKGRYISHEEIREIFQSFRNATEGELWESRDALIVNYQRQGEWDKLLNGKAGINVIQTFHAQVIAYAMKKWIVFTIDSAKRVFTQFGFVSAEHEKEIQAVEDFCLSMSTQILNRGRPKRLQKKIAYDIPEWVSAHGNNELSSFAWPEPKVVNFVISDRMYHNVDSQVLIYGDSDVGLSQAVKRINVHDLWRVATIDRIT
jgi:radical SAM superfamily enzyme YgiQ (UPF0313 family)